MVQCRSLPPFGSIHLTKVQRAIWEAQRSLPTNRDRLGEFMAIVAAAGRLRSAPPLVTELLTEPDMAGTPVITTEGDPTVFCLGATRSGEVAFASVETTPLQPDLLPLSPRVIERFSPYLADRDLMLTSAYAGSRLDATARLAGVRRCVARSFGLTLSRAWELTEFLSIGEDESLTRVGELRQRWYHDVRCGLLLTIPRPEGVMTVAHPHVIILAAGKGTRMNSDLPKVLHQLGGKPMLRHVLNAASALEPSGMTVVVGFGASQVRRVIESDEANCVEQREQRGTGHAVQVALAGVPAEADPVVVLYGDVPLIRPAVVSAMLTHLYSFPEGAKAGGVLLVARLQDPTGYGRVKRGPSGAISSIIEEKDADYKTLSVKEVNLGLGVYRRAALEAGLPLLEASNAQGELYLTDLPKLASRTGWHIFPMLADDASDYLGVNTVEELELAERRLSSRSSDRSKVVDFPGGLPRSFLW